MRLVQRSRPHAWMGMGGQQQGPPQGCGCLFCRLRLDQSQPGVVDAHPGQRIRLTCRTEGFPPPTIEWQRDGQTLSSPRSGQLLSPPCRPHPTLCRPVGEGAASSHWPVRGSRDGAAGQKAPWAFAEQSVDRGAGQRTGGGRGREAGTVLAVITANVAPREREAGLHHTVCRRAT